MTDKIQPTHPELVKALVKSPFDILIELNAIKADLWHAATGIAGEGGELLEAFLIAENFDGVDKENVIEELGDLYFYSEQLGQRLGFTLPTVWTQTSRDRSDALLLASTIAVKASAVLDAVKKHVIYNKELVKAQVSNPHTELVWLMDEMAVLFGVTRQDCLDANIKKLSVRYGKTYSDGAAQNRADKAGERKYFGKTE